MEHIYNEDFDYIDDIYIYLYITNQNINEDSSKVIKKNMELLDENIYEELKKNNITTKTFINLYYKIKNEYGKQKKKIILKKFNRNIDDLIEMQEMLALEKLNFNTKKIKSIQNNINKWWNWISNSMIDKLINHKYKNEKIKMCKRIFKLFNTYHKLNLLKEYSFKLLIIDLKNNGRQNLDLFKSDLLKSFYIYIRNKLIDKYGKIFSFSINSNNIEEIKNYLILNENMYNVIENNIEITHIENKSLLKLHLLYYNYKSLKLNIKQQYKKNKTIVLNDILVDYLNILHHIINEYKNASTETILMKELIHTKNTKKNYTIYIHYLNSVILSIFKHEIKSNPHETDFLKIKLNCLLQNTTL